MRALALLALLAAGPLAAQEGDDNVEGQEIQTEPISDRDLARAMRERMRADPRIADTLAERIARSTIAPRITDETDPARKVRAIRQWIDSDPDSAAGLAVGLGKDDQSGTHRFEQSITNTMKTRLQVNPDSKKGIYGRLKKSGKDSRLMMKDEEMSGEEQREIMKNLFEGQGGQSNRIITQEEKAPPEKGAAFNSGYYDRLGKGNLRGYSPDLQVMQSALNQRRAPGAPKLIETGKLDYETLSYPKHSMRYDISTLEARLRYERNYALAKLLGREKGMTREMLLDPALEAKLLAEAGERAASLSPRFAKRMRALERAVAALKDFEGSALASQDPLKITRELLLTLGDKQKEAARWITVASLEEELQRLEAEEGFLSEGLKAAVARCPVDAGTRAAYLRRGEEFLKRLKALKANDQEAVDMLETDGWLARLERIEDLLVSNGELRRGLFRNVSAFVKTPYRLAALQAPRPRWRELLDGLLLRFLPSSSRARELKAAAAQTALLKDVFVKIAMGSLDAAHTILSSYEPSQAPPSKR